MFKHLRIYSVSGVNLDIYGTFVWEFCGDIITIDFVVEVCVNVDEYNKSSKLIHLQSVGLFYYNIHRSTEAKPRNVRCMRLRALNAKRQKLKKRDCKREFS